MIDPRCAAVLIRSYKANDFQDKTSEISRYAIDPGCQRVEITFNGRRAPYSYGLDRVRVLERPVRRDLAAGDRVEIRGSIWESINEVLIFTGTDGRQWWRIFYRNQQGEVYITYPASDMRITASATANPAVADVLGYWRIAVSLIPNNTPGQDDPLKPEYDKLAFIHPESVLNLYLTGAPIEPQPLDIAPIFPFRCNLSQRTAVENAIASPISVIEGPPGTGKTETILNLIANIVAVQHKTVAVVSFGNAAVDNVRDKLAELGFDHVIGNLGRREKRADFFAGQAARNAQVALFLAGTPDAPPDPGRLAELDQRLRGLQDAERTRAERRQDLAAHRLELRHFEDHLRQAELPDLERLPLLRRSADRILDYLAESEVELAGAGPGPLRRIRKYFRYGSLRTLDPADTDVVLRLQLAYSQASANDIVRIAHFEARRCVQAVAMAAGR